MHVRAHGGRSNNATAITITAHPPDRPQEEKQRAEAAAQAARAEKERERSHERWAAAEAAKAELQADAAAEAERIAAAKKKAAVRFGPRVPAAVVASPSPAALEFSAPAQQLLLLLHWTA